MPIYKDKKRGTWGFRVYVEDYDGISRQKSRSGFPTKSQAKDEEQKLIEKYKQQFNDITFQELYDIFIKHKEQTLKYSSVAALKVRFEKHILPFFKDYKLSKINHKKYIEWKDVILSKNLGYRYKSELHGAMVSILNYAMDFYNLEKNIASKVGNFSKQDYKPKVDFWTYDEFQQFINVVNDNVYYTFFNLLYYTGIRLGEALALTWNDIHENYIDINKTMLKEKHENEFLIGTPKTPTSNRKIMLDLKTIKDLEQLKKFYSSYYNFNNNWFAFGGLIPLSRTTISRRKNDYCKLANVKQIKIHDLRHSHATFLISNNIPITVISHRLGHSDINITLKIYSHLIPEDENKAIALINLLNKEKSVTREIQENIIEKNNKTPINKELIN